MIAFPIGDLLCEQACYDFLLKRLHPKGMRCAKGHALPANATPHDRHRPPIFDYRCSQIVQILRGFAQGAPTLHLAREIGIDRVTLLQRRHRMQGVLAAARDKIPSFAGVVEADELYQNAGEKRKTASRSRRSAPSARQ